MSSHERRCSYQYAIPVVLMCTEVNNIPVPACVCVGGGWHSLSVSLLDLTLLYFASFFLLCLCRTAYRCQLWFLRFAFCNCNWGCCRRWQTATSKECRNISKWFVWQRVVRPIAFELVLECSTAVVVRVVSGNNAIVGIFEFELETWRLVFDLSIWHLNLAFGIWHLAFGL